MSDPHTNHTSNSTHTTRETHVTEKRSGSSMAFIIGGLVVAVAVIAWLFLGGTDVDNAGVEPGVGDTNVTVEAPEASASSGAIADGDAPAADVDVQADAPTVESVPIEPAEPAEPVEPQTAN